MFCIINLPLNYPYKFTASRTQLSTLWPYWQTHVSRKFRVSKSTAVWTQFEFIAAACKYAMSRGYDVYILMQHRHDLHVFYHGLLIILCLFLPTGTPFSGYNSDACTYQVWGKCSQKGYSRSKIKDEWTTIIMPERFRQLFGRFIFARFS